MVFLTVQVQAPSSPVRSLKTREAGRGQGRGVDGAALVGHQPGSLRLGKNHWGASPSRVGEQSGLRTGASWAALGRLKFRGPNLAGLLSQVLPLPGRMRYWQELGSAGATAWRRQL